MQDLLQIMPITWSHTASALTANYSAPGGHTQKLCNEYEQRHARLFGDRIFSRKMGLLFK